MDVIIKGKNLDVGDALRSHIEAGISGTVHKYFQRAHDATVVMSREAHLFRADISVHPLRGVLVQGHAAADDAYAAFDAGLEHIAKQVRRYKRRLNDQRRRASDEITLAQHYVIAAESEDEELPADAQPAIIAELATEVATLTVGEAVMRMDLADVPVMMFRNIANGGLNVVYRRADGNIGWIDPASNQPASSRPTNTTKA